MGAPDLDSYEKPCFYKAFFLPFALLSKQRRNDLVKPTIIFLHGGPGFKDYLRPFFEPINGADCIFYDQEQGSEVTVDDLVSQLDKFVDKASVRPWLLGHSWGGVLAVEYAKENQDKLAGIALLGTGLSSEQWLQYRDDLKAKGLQDASPEEIFLVPDEFEAGKPFLEKIWNGFSDETFESISKKYLKRYNLLTSLAGFQIPVLSFYGDSDLRFSPEIAKSFKKYNDRVIEVEIPNAGHFPFLSKPNSELFISEICRFSKLK